MQLARVIGHATATVKHPSLSGWRLLVVQPLDAEFGADGDPIIVVDRQGSRRGQNVIVTGDGPSVREMIGAENTPVRFAVIGLADE